MSANGDFNRVKQALGLNKFGVRTTEISKQSPYNYRDNCLMYLPQNMPFPNPKSNEYILAVTNEIEKLIRASKGRAAVLFTGYSVMGMVYKKLVERNLSDDSESNLPYEFYKLERGTSSAIERFKKSKRGVLLASGAFWEGIDIPGDALSMLIIVKLPFQAPNAVGEYERTRYPNFGAYFHNVIIPEMIIKLKQGFGRLFRTEFDTGVFALLDCRAGVGCAYHMPLLAAVPDLRITDSCLEVEKHLGELKPVDYWI